MPAGSKTEFVISATYAADMIKHTPKELVANVPRAARGTLKDNNSHTVTLSGDAEAYAFSAEITGA